MAKFNFIRYANCWEDANLLLESLDIEGKTGISVLSGGDNTLAMLLKNPKKIAAFDINETQIYLFELKRAGFLNLNHQGLLTLLGIIRDKHWRFRNKYHDVPAWTIFQSLKKDMSKEAFDYFSAHPEFFEKGIVNIGKFEHYFELFQKFVVPLFTTKKRLKKLADFADIKQQADFYRRKIDNHRLKLIFKSFFGFKMMGKLGRDKDFYDYVDNRASSGERLKARFDWGICHVSNRDNPYIHYVLTGQFNPKHLPLYLRPENFEIIRERIGKIEVAQGYLTKLQGHYDFANLSDIFEYLDPATFELNQEWLRKIMKPGARIAYYNMQSKKFLDQGFELLEKQSKKWSEEMQAYFYEKFLVYERTHDDKTKKTKTAPKTKKSR